MWVRCCFLHKYQTIHGLPPRPRSKGKLKLRFAPHSIYHRTWYYCASCEGMKVCFGLVFLFFFLGRSFMYFTVCSVLSNIRWCLCCCVLGHNLAKGEQFLVWVPPVGLGPRGAEHGRSGMHDCIGRDIFQHLHCAALGFCPKFSCQLCIFPEERAVQLSCERKHRVFGMGWLHLQSVGMNVFAGGKLEPVAARPLFWRACVKSASNLPFFN